MNTYRIRFRDHVTPGWGPWFEGMDIRCEENGEVTLTAPVVDQAALYGVLNTIRDLGLTLLSVNLVGAEELPASSSS
jgi:hypothetical protein